MGVLSFLKSIVPLLLPYSAPIIAAGLGGLFSERSGVVNIGLEGLMLFGAFVSATVTVLIEPTVGVAAPWIGILCGMLGGVLLSLLHAFACVNLKADHVISGTALNLIAAGVSLYLCTIIFNKQRTEPFVNGINKKPIPVLADIPVIGDIFFSQVHLTSYIVILLCVVSWFVLYKTAFGLRLRSVGENPHAADSVGINVYRMQYIGVLLSGLFAGLGGSIVVLTQNMQFSGAIIHGTGFIALAALIFGKWKPMGILAAGLFFGFSQAFGVISYQFAALENLPSQFFAAFPYVLTIIALIFAGKTIGPKASGVIYDKSK